jgi:hypothetical protein
MSIVGTQYFLGNTEIINSFVGDIPIVINPILPPAPLFIEYLIVAGGGGGGCLAKGGGGGAGGYLSGTLNLSTGSYSIVVGTGGNGSVPGNPIVFASNGLNSTAFSLTAIGGGRGASPSTTVTPNTLEAPGNGGSGGGGATQINFNPRSYPTGGLGTAGQGNNGGSIAPLGGNGACGGGGASEQGKSGSFSVGGAGGNGLQWLDGNYYAGGGGGVGFGQFGSSDLGGAGGLGGGGNGAKATGENGGDAVQNTGGGGGGSSEFPYRGGNGGSGIVKLRYEGSGSKASGGTITYDSGSNYTYHTFTTSGTFTY